MYRWFLCIGTGGTKDYRWYHCIRIKDSIVPRRYQLRYEETLFTISTFYNTVSVLFFFTLLMYFFYIFYLPRKKNYLVQLIGTGIAHWIQNPLRRTCEHNQI